MTPALRRYRLTLSLAAVNLLLIAVVATELWLGAKGKEEPDELSAAPAEKQDIHVVPKFDFRLLPVTSYREIVERSLFVSTRQAAPSEQAVAGDGGQSEGPPPFVLVGVVIHPTTRVALLRQASGTRVLRVPEGNEASGWRVAKVNRDSVLLRRGGLSQELKLKKSQKKSENAVVTPPVQPQPQPGHGGSQPQPGHGGSQPQPADGEAATP